MEKCNKNLNTIMEIIKNLTHKYTYAVPFQSKHCDAKYRKGVKK